VLGLAPHPVGDQGTELDLSNSSRPTIARTRSLRCSSCSPAPSLNSAISVLHQLEIELRGGDGGRAPGRHWCSLLKRVTGPTGARRIYLVRE